MTGNMFRTKILLIATSVFLGISTAAKPMLAETVDYFRFENSLQNSVDRGASAAVMNGSPGFSSSIPVNPVPRTGRRNLASLDLPSSGAVSFDKAFPFNNLGDATLEFWVKPTQRTHEQDIFWTTTTPGDTNRFNFFLGDNATGTNSTFNFDYREPNGTLHPLFNSQHPGGVLIPTTVPFDVWTFIAVVRSGNSYSVYFNDSPVPAATVVDVNPNLPNNTGWTLNGRFLTSPNFGAFAGQVDEIRLSNRALPPSEFLNSCPFRDSCRGDR